MDTLASASLGMSELSCDVILLITSYLDDVSYVHLWISCKRYCLLLRSEAFLRQLFRHRHPWGLSPQDLHRGFANIINCPTVTYIKDRTFVNHYRSGRLNFVFDIFERLFLLKGEHLYD